VIEWFKSEPETRYCGAIKKLVSRWNRCVEKRGKLYREVRFHLSGLKTKLPLMIPQYAFRAWCSVKKKKHRNNFTFPFTVLRKEDLFKAKEVSLRIH
jgi:hypothetical protein